jgi:ubiquinone/menaquinone biosynthesis C-methylase UbiE
MEKLPEGLANSGAKNILKELEVISGGKVLDVATLKGDFIKTLMKTFKEYDSFLGIDIEFEGLESIEREFNDKPVEFMEMNAEKLIFQNNSFDTVSLSHSLHHLADIDKVLSEMMRVLKPDGYFIIQEPFHDGSQSEAQQIDIDQHHWEAQIDSLLNEQHNFTFRKNEIKEIVKKLGLRDVKTVKSSHYVKCLFCDEKFDCEDPKNPSIIKFVIKGIENNLKRLSKLKDHPDYEKLKEEGKNLKEKVKNTGSASASHLFFIGRK